jgi:tetratricopeptide (TPR) repeat protein
MKHFLKGADLYTKINVISWNAITHLFLGETYFEIEEYQKALTHYKQSILILEHNKILPSLINLNRIGVRRAKVMSNEKDIDLKTLYAYVEDNNSKLYDGWMKRYIGEILLNIDEQNVSETEDWIKKAIEADRGNDMKWHLGRDYILYSKFYKQKNDPSRAKETMDKAIEIFKECGADGWVERYEKELASLS